MDFVRKMSLNIPLFYLLYRRNLINKLYFLYFKIAAIIYWLLYDNSISTNNNNCKKKMIHEKWKIWRKDNFPAKQVYIKNLFKVSTFRVQQNASISKCWKRFIQKEKHYITITFCSYVRPCKVAIKRT